MDMLQVNKKLIYFFLIILLSSCKEKVKQCSLENSIFSRITLKEFKNLRSLSVNGKKRNNLLKVNSNGVYIKIDSEIYDELRKDKVLFVINDSLNYIISEIRIDSVERQTMVNRINDCFLVSYKVNDSIIYHHQEIIINH